MKDKFYDDGKTRKDLIQNCIVTKTSYSDVVDIVNILADTLVGSKRDVVRQLLYSNADLDNSVKIVDTRDNKIYGLLIFSKFNIDCGSPIRFVEPMICDYLLKFSHLNGHSFVIDERLRGTSFDKKMLLNQKEYINTFDFVWCGVENELHTHKYWERLGFLKFMETDEAKFYIYPKDKNMFLDIFILKAMSLNKNVEKDYYL